MLSYDPASKEPYQMRLDFPIVGLAQNAKDKKERLLVVEHSETLAAFSKNIRRVDREEEQP